MITHALILAGSLLLIVFCRIACRSFTSPVAIVSVWWTVWAGLAASGVTGLFPLGGKTLAVIYLALVSLLGGAAVGVRMAAPIIAHNELKVSRAFDVLAPRVMFIVGSFALAWNLVLLPRALPLIRLYGGSYRAAVFGSEADAVFGSGWLTKIYSMSATPFSYLCVFLAITLVLLRGRIYYAFFALLVIMTSDLVRLGRGGTYTLLLVGMSAVLLVRPFLKRRQARSGKRQVFLVAGVLLLFAISGVGLTKMSGVRHEAETSKVKDIVYNVVNYHTLGFGLLNLEISGDHLSEDRGVGFGRLTFGGIEQVLSLAIRRINSSHKVYVLNMDDLWRQEPRIVGMLPSGAAVTGNAFYTVLFSLYHDGRWIFIIAFPFWYGLFLTRRYIRFLQTGGQIHLLKCLVWIYCGLFAIFLSPPEGTTLWLVLLAVYVLTIFAGRMKSIQGMPNSFTRTEGTKRSL